MYYLRQELMHVSEDTQLPPDWVSEWKRLLNHFCNPPWVIKNHEIKRMITIGMIKRQVWIADDDEFDNTVKNS